MQMPRPSLAVLFALVLSQPLAAGTRDLQAHQHGHVTLRLAVDGTSVEMILEAPGADIVGFEHAAETDAQKAAVEGAKADLADPMAIFVLPEAAGCTGEAAEVDLHQDGNHSAFEVEYALTCTDPSALTEIETRFFDLYPSVEEIEVEYATPAGQGAGELEPGEALPLPTS
ncbi:MAG: DUF2796 domain-containing protein [Pseudomonadota bacterium]